MGMERKIGLIIADREEYLPIERMAMEIGGEKKTFYSRSGCAFEFSSADRSAKIFAIHSGIGKVNAAAAAMHFADLGVDIIFNLGYSGGISGVRRGELIVGSGFLEHDFDLTTIGYSFAEKPGQEWIYHANEDLVSMLTKLLGCSSGMFVTGDRFVNDDLLRVRLKELFSASACDMETAAIASISSMAGIPFASVRRISDDAGDDAEASYREMNNNEGEELARIAVRCLTELVGADLKSEK